MKTIPMPGRLPCLRAAAASAMAFWVLLVAGCGRRASYPLGSTVDFEIRCVQNLWPGPPAAPLDLRQAFCACLVRGCEKRYSAEEFDQIRLALSRAGYRTDAAGVPTEFVRLMGECRDALDHGGLSVE